MTYYKRRLPDFTESEIETTPIASVRYLIPYIASKKVFDFGCGDGSFAKEMKKYQADVICVEKNIVLAKEARRKGLTVHIKDFMDIDLTDGMTIYCATNNEAIEALWRRIKNLNVHLTLISYQYPVPGVKPNDIITVPLHHVWLDEFVFLIYKT